GLEVAEYLSSKADNITVVEMLDEMGKDLGQLRKICVMESLIAENIELITDAKCTEMKDHAVVIEKNGRLEELPSDSIVIAVGAKSRSTEDISKYCTEKNIPFHTIGDAICARRALNATAEAY